MGKDIPLRWFGNIKADPNQIFTIIIKSENKSDILNSYDFNKKNRNCIFDLLKGDSGNESSEEWIKLIKSARSIEADIFMSEATRNF
jgi:hypothetical protein